MLKRFSGKAASYLSAASWLVKDIFTTLRLRIVFLVGLSFAVTGSKVVTFGGFLLFLKHFISAEPITVPKLGYQLPVDPFLWGPVILISGLVMGALIYIESHLRVSYATKYGLDAAERVFNVIARPDFEARFPRKNSYKYKQRLLVADSLAMMRAAMMILGCILPIMQLVTAAFILVTMSWHLALVIVAMSILYLVPFYFINRRVVRAARRRLENMPELKSAVAQSLKDIAFPPFRPLLRERAKTNLFDDSVFKKNFDDFTIIRTVKGAVTFLSTTFLALFMLIVIVYITKIGASAALIGIAAYALVLIHAYDSANKLSGLVATFNRFFPQFKRIVDALAMPIPMEAPQSARQPVVRIGVARADTLQGSQDAVSLLSGHQYSIVQPMLLGYRTRDEWLAVIGLDRSKQARPYLVPSPADVPDLTLRDILRAGDAGANADQTERVLALPFVAELVAGLTAGLDTPWSAVALRMPPPVALAFLVAPAANMNANAILIGSKTVGGLSDEQMSAISGLVPDASWLLDVDSAGVPDNLPETATCVVLATDEGVVGIGPHDWAVAAIIANPARFAKHAGKGQDDGLMDDDEEMGEGML